MPQSARNSLGDKSRILQTVKLQARLKHKTNHVGWLSRVFAKLGLGLESNLLLGATHEVQL